MFQNLLLFVQVYYCSIKINTQYMNKFFYSIYLLFSIGLIAQNKPIEITKITEPIVFDGVINELFWLNTSSFTLTRQSPDYGSKPSEETELMMVYDEQYLYFAAKLFYNNVAQVQDFAKQRDAGGPNDYIAFALDGYNDKTNGQAFATTPSGLRWDAALTFDSKGVSINDNWNTYWEVKTSRDDKGWYAEFKIPLSSLRFKSDNEDVQLNLIIWRKIAYNNQLLVFPDAKPDFGVLSFANIANGFPIIFKGIKSTNPVYITPYALGGLSGNQILNENNTHYRNIFNSNFQAGADFKYSLSSELTIDATINTDFAQIEADNFQVNLSRSSIFFPEKREFFLERTNNFNFTFDNNNNAFYSRKIGLEDGKLSKIYGGARIVGRIKKWDIGLLNMQTEDLRNESSKNIGLFRFKRQIGNENNYLGGIFTSEIGKNNYKYFTYGIDNQFLLPFKSYLKWALAKTTESSISNSFLSTKNLRLNAKLEMPSQVGFYYLLNYSIIGNAYNNTLGFEERENISSYTSKIGYTLFTKKSKSIFKQNFQVITYKIDGYETHSKESLGLDFQYNIEKKNGAGINAKTYFREEILQNPLVLSESISIPVGYYDFKGFNLFINSPTGKSIYGNALLDIGSFYNGNKISTSFFGRFDSSKLLQFQIDYKYDKIKFSNEIVQFENHLVSFSLILNFSTKLSVSTLTQYDNLNKRIGSNFRLRFNTKEGNDLFLVITNINNTDRYRKIPTLSSLQSWLVVMKYKYTFNL